MKVLVIAPHPDDETLGCGGTLLKLAAQGAELHWMIVTAMTAETGFSAERMAQRQDEIARLGRMLGFAGIHQLGFPCAMLDRVALSDLVGAMGRVVRTVAPHTVFLPFPGDVHSDHRVVYQAGYGCAKWFRYPSVRRVLTYEALSETDAGSVLDVGFRPNLFVDISDHLDAKIAAMDVFGSELGEFPFPRSERALRHLAGLRGAQAGCEAAEALYVCRMP